MTSARARIRSRLTACGWPAESVSPGLRAVVVVTDLVALVWAVVALVDVQSSWRGWGQLALLVGLAIAFEEGVHHAARLQIRLGAQLRSDMTSVWMVTGAVALGAGKAVLLLVAVLGFVWFRQQRPSGEEFYRKLFTASGGIIGALAGAWAFSAAQTSLEAAPTFVRGTIPVAAAILASAAANRLPVTAAMLALGMRGRQLLGAKGDNLVELATLSLGGLVGGAMLYQPLLAILVVAPLVTLQRGAVVRDLEAAAITDAKTGLLNAVAWEQLAKRELERARRAGTTVSVAILDIDRFKVVNDRFGHLVGDKVLAGVARAVKESLRGYDGLGRFGGEEFVIVLPDSDQREALVVAERVRLRVNRLSVLGLVPELDDVTGRGSERLSVSVGVAVLAGDGADLHDLLHAADQALYRAKWNGRNQVQLARRGDQRPDTVRL